MKPIKRSLIFSVLFSTITITQSCKSGSDDATIQNNVNTKISNRPGISATVSKGVVIISGNCPDQDCKTNTEKAVKDVKGVKEVVNNIAIVVPGETTAPVQITPDETLKTSVSTVVKQYKNVEADVDNGVITLRGQINRDDLQKLIVSLNELRPKKIQNELIIK